MYVLSPFPLRFRSRQACTVAWHNRGNDVSAGLRSVLSEWRGLTEADWTRRIAIVERCLTAMQQIQGNRSNAETLDRTILNVRAMLLAMKQRDRVMTRDMGQAALLTLSSAGVF